MIFQKGDTLLFTGDSITDCGRSASGESEKSSIEGLGSGYASIIKAYLNAFYPELDLRIINKGSGGNTTADILARMQKDHLDFNPDVIVMTIGGNDVWRHFDSSNDEKIDREKFEANLTEILEKFKTSARKIYVLAPFLVKKDDGAPLYKMWMEYGEISKKVSTKAGALFIELQEVFDKCMEKAEPSHYSSDTVHPTICGHVVIAKKLIDAFTI